MRAVLVLIVLGLCAWGIYRFLPTAEVEAKGGGTEARAIPFLERPEPSPRGAGGALTGAAAGRATEAPSAPAVAPPRGGAAADTGAGAFGLSAQDAPSGVAQDLVLAQALLFGGVTEVERALARLEVEDAERRLCLSFAHALSGNRKAGIQMASGLDDPGVLAAPDRALLQAALSGKASSAAAPASTGQPLVRRAMRLRLIARDARQQLDEGRYPAAAAGFSEVLLGALQGPWEAERDALVAWTEGLDAAQARHRWDPQSDWPSVEIVVQDGDTLTHIRKRYLDAHPSGLVCTGLIARANQLTGYIHPGDTLRVPTEEASVIVDLSSRWLLYLLGGEVAAAWEVGVGRSGQETLQGTFRVGDKQREPTWFPRGQDPQYYPDNPLGTRWLAWYRDGQKTSYGFHGTWEPESIGKAASDGCIRLRNEQVEVLFEILPVDARITVQE